MPPHRQAVSVVMCNPDRPHPDKIGSAIKPFDIKIVKPMKFKNYIFIYNLLGENILNLILLNQLSESLELSTSLPRKFAIHPHARLCPIGIRL